MAQNNENSNPTPKFGEDDPGHPLIRTKSLTSRKTFSPERLNYLAQPKKRWNPPPKSKEPPSKGPTKVKPKGNVGELRRKGSPVTVNTLTLQDIAAALNSPKSSRPRSRPKELDSEEKSEKKAANLSNLTVRPVVKRESPPEDPYNLLDYLVGIHLKQIREKRASEAFPRPWQTYVSTLGQNFVISIDVAGYSLDTIRTTLKGRMLTVEGQTIEQRDEEDPNDGEEPLQLKDLIGANTKEIPMHRRTHFTHHVIALPHGFLTRGLKTGVDTVLSLVVVLGKVDKSMTRLENPEVTSLKSSSSKRAVRETGNGLVNKWKAAISGNNKLDVHSHRAVPLERSRSRSRNSNPEAERLVMGREPISFWDKDGLTKATKKNADGKQFTPEVKHVASKYQPLYKRKEPGKGPEQISLKTNKVIGTKYSETGHNISKKYTRKERRKSPKPSGSNKEKGGHEPPKPEVKSNEMDTQSSGIDLSKEDMEERPEVKGSQENMSTISNEVKTLEQKESSAALPPTIKNSTFHSQTQTEEPKIMDGEGIDGRKSMGTSPLKGSGSHPFIEQPNAPELAANQDAPKDKGVGVADEEEEDDEIRSRLSKFQNNGTLPHVPGSALEYTVSYTRITIPDQLSSPLSESSEKPVEEEPPKEVQFQTRLSRVRFASSAPEVIMISRASEEDIGGVLNNNQIHPHPRSLAPSYSPSDESSIDEDAGSSSRDLFSGYQADDSSSEVFFREKSNESNRIEVKKVKGIKNLMENSESEPSPEIESETNPKIQSEIESGSTQMIDPPKRPISVSSEVVNEVNWVNSEGL